ncbi:MAG: hypothetical protein ACRCZF_10335 [Gemmataceae bacterium]
MIVVKLGGSLYQQTGLVSALQMFRAEHHGLGPIHLVCGGGAFADAVRELDRVQELGEELAHAVALASLAAPRRWLQMVLSDYHIVETDLFCAKVPELPASWAVTTDSIAAWYAALHGAEQLILLKSVNVPPPYDWHALAAAGVVDAYFPRAAERYSGTIQCVDFVRYAMASGAK